MVRTKKYFRIFLSVFMLTVLFMVHSISYAEDLTEENTGGPTCETESKASTNDADNAPDDVEADSLNDVKEDTNGEDFSDNNGESDVPPLDEIDLNQDNQENLKEIVSNEVSTNDISTNEEISFDTGSLSVDDIDGDKTFIAKYTFVSEEISPDTTLDDIFTSKDYTPNFTLFAELPVYIKDETSYVIKADAPYNNGFASIKPLDVCFARANYEGEVIEDGVIWDNESCTAIINKDVLEGKKTDDFADMQIQLLIAAKNHDTSLNISLNINNPDELIEVEEMGEYITSRAYDFPRIKLSTDETSGNITPHELGIFINNCPYPLNDDQYEFTEDGNLTILTPAALIENIEIYVMNRDSMLLGVDDFVHSNWTASCFPTDGWSYVKPELNMSDMYEGKWEDCSIYIGRNLNDIKIGSLASAFGFGSYYEDRYNYGNLNHICLPLRKFGKDLKFYTNKECTEFSYGVNGSSYYDQPIPGYCTHISKSFGLNKGKEVNGWIQLQNIDKSNPNYVSYIFTCQTYPGTHNGDSSTYQAQSAAFMFRQYKKPKVEVDAAVKAVFDIKLTKKNQYGITLEGAEIELYDSDGQNIIDRQKTDVNGEIVFKNLAPNKTYYYAEVKAPKGYKLPLDKNNQCIKKSLIAKGNPDKYQMDGIFIDNVRVDGPYNFGALKYVGNSRYMAYVDVLNKTSKITLPSTGNIGRNLIYLTGLFLLMI